MKSNGSKYVIAVFAVLIGYFGYQWWWNPARAVKRQLGELAASLSVPVNEDDLARVTRIVQLRRYFAPDLRVQLGTGGTEIASRDALFAAISTLRPAPGGWEVQFVDVQIQMDSRSASRAYLTVELKGRDARTGGPTVDAREASATLAWQNGVWVVTTAELRETPGTAPRP
jgi:hypothetical protein